MRSAEIDRMTERFGRGIFLDGGLASELERLGLDLDDPLWSARILIDEPEAIQAVHLDYLMAGADCITTASYQASVPGLLDAGLSRRQVKEVLRKSVRLAQESCDYLRHAEGKEPAGDDEAMPMVAASCGPYGAYLADGSEFQGDYDLTEAQLYDFHAPRVEMLAESAPDLLAFETIPQAREARAIARLMKLSSIPAWVSFQCRDAEHLASGEPIEAGLEALSDVDSVVAVGVNCVAPDLVLPLLDRLGSLTSKRRIVYPNAGGQWNRSSRCWEGEEDLKGFVSMSQVWRQLGADAIGGCCRTTPDYIKRMKKAIGGS